VVAKLTQGFVVGAGIGVVVRERGVTDMVEGGAVGGDTAGKMPAVLATGGTPVLHAIGAGNFARTMLLPHVKGNIALGTIVNATGLSARHVKEKFGFANAETDAAKVFTGRTGVTPVIQDGGHLARPNEAVMICTRHHLHAPMVLSALQANRHVFVEKPLCLTRVELADIDSAMQSTQGSVMVGFNRRFAPATVELKKLLAKTPGPKSLAYHVFAGPLAPDHWYANLDESGGRVLGEACHMLDFACFVLEAKPVSVTAQTVWPAQGRSAFPDSVTAQVEFCDGSSFQLIYSAEGDFAFPKETFRVFGSGLVAECENFMKLSIFQKRKETVKKFSSKGHAEEMAAWLAFLKGEAKHPMPYAQSRQSMVLTFAVLEAIRERRSIGLAEY
jgi:predicted dehydrogenase